MSLLLVLHDIECLFNLSNPNQLFKNPAQTDQLYYCHLAYSPTELEFEAWTAESPSRCATNEPCQKPNGF